MENRITRSLVERYLTVPFWEPQYHELFTDDFSMDIPSAPPGMPQHFDAYDARQYRQWLLRTVDQYSSRIIELYGTPDPEVYWAVREVQAEVRWGKEPGHFESRIFCRVELTQGKIRYVAINWNPLAFLYAVHAQVPIFKMDLYDPSIDAILQQPQPENPTDAQTLDMTPDAVARRIQNNLDAFRSGDYFYGLEHLATFAPNHASIVWFLPPEMKESYPEEMMPRVEAWTMASCPYPLDFDTAGRYWATDDPKVYFAEYMCAGQVNWVGNDKPGWYRNRYFYILRFDDAGRIACCEEILNPINKFNSIGVSIPSFPYFY